MSQALYVLWRERVSKWRCGGCRGHWKRRVDRRMAVAHQITWVLSSHGVLGADFTWLELKWLLSKRFYCQDVRSYYVIQHCSYHKTFTYDFAEQISHIHSPHSFLNVLTYHLLNSLFSTILAMQSSSNVILWCICLKRKIEKLKKKFWEEM